MTSSSVYYDPDDLIRDLEQGIAHPEYYPGLYEFIEVVADVEEVNKRLREGGWEVLDMVTVSEVIMDQDKIVGLRKGPGFKIGLPKQQEVPAKSVEERLAEVERVQGLLESAIAKIQDWKFDREKDFQDIEALAEEQREREQFRKNNIGK